MKDAGFSLIEVLVALALTSMLALSGSVLFRETQAMHRQAMQKADQIQRISLLHTTLRHDLEQLAPHPVDVDGESAFSGLHTQATSEGFKWTFIRSGRKQAERTPSSSDLVRVQYSFSKTGVTRTIWPRSHPAQDTPQVQQSILANVSMIEARFLSGREWRTDWRREQRDPPIAIELVWQDEQNQTFRHIFLVRGGS